MTGPRNISQQTQFLVQPDSYVNECPGETEPNVNGISILIPANVGAVTITNFKKAQPNQTIRILGDVNTTIADNANIRTNTGANKTLAADIVYTFTFINNIWYEAE